MSLSGIETRSHVGPDSEGRLVHRRAPEKPGIQQDARQRFLQYKFSEKKQNKLQEAAGFAAGGAARRQSDDLTRGSESLVS